jgi:hypothetical protein
MGVIFHQAWKSDTCSCIQLEYHCGYRGSAEDTIWVHHLISKDPTVHSFFVLWCWVSLLRRVLWMTRPYVQDLVMWVLISVLLWSLNTNLVHWVSDSIVEHCCQEYVNLRNELTTITLLCLKQTEMTLLVGQLQQRQFQLPLLGWFVVYVMLNAVDWVGIGMPWISAACFCWKNTFTLWRIKKNHW